MNAAAAGHGARLKAAWEVRAGLVPGQAIAEYTRQFFYTSEDGADDEAGAMASVDPATPIALAYHAQFSKTRAIAMDYFLQVSDPRFNNWAEITFIWY